MSKMQEPCLMTFIFRVLCTILSITCMYLNLYSNELIVHLAVIFYSIYFARIVVLIHENRYSQLFVAALLLILVCIRILYFPDTNIPAFCLRMLNGVFLWTELFSIYREKESFYNSSSSYVMSTQV